MKQRILNEVSFAASCFLALARLRGRFDLVLTLTPPQELTPAGWLLSRLLRARYALYVMDLMPEVAISLGMIRDRRAIAALRALAGFCYRRAVVTAASSEEFKRGVEAYGIAPADVVCVPNGIDTNLFRPTTPDPLLREEMGLGERFIALYAGTHGFSHDLDSILAAAEMAQGEGDESIAFVLIGDGSDKPRIRADAEARGLRNVYFHDPVERERLPSVIAVADAMLITFRRLSVNEGVIPIKLYDAMACAKPIVLAIAGEARAMFLQAEAGIAVEPSDPAGLLAALRTFQRDPEAARCSGENGRRFVEANYSRERCAEILRQALLCA